MSFVALMFFSLTSSVYAATDGPLTTTTNAAKAASAGDNNGFETTPTYATSSNNFYAVSASTGSGNATDGCATFNQAEDDAHDYYNFGSTVPAGASINGITVDTESKWSTGTGINQMCVELSWDGGTSWTSTANTTGDLGTTDTAVALGGVSNTWGRTWTASELSNANFRLRVMLDPGGANTLTASLDYLAVTITYTVPTAIALTGTLYSDEGVTPITTGKTINVAVGTSTPSLHTTTSNGSGVWSVTLDSLHSVGPSTPILVWVDGDTTTRAALFTKASTTATTTGLDLYQNRVIVSHEGTSGTSTNIGDMTFYDSDNDADIQYTSNSGALTVLMNQELHIKTGKTFSASGTVTVRGNASSTSLTDGTLHLPASSVYTAVGTTTLAGSFNASSSATFSNATSTLIMNATTTGKNMLTPFTTMGHVTFNGSGGGWTFATSATTSNFIITNGSVTAPSYLSVFGSYANYGTFTHNGGTVYFASTTEAQGIAGNLTGTSALGNVRFAGTSTLATTTSGLIGRWNFEDSQTVWTSPTTGTTNDSSGMGTVGTFTNMTQSSTTGRIGQAVTFDGVDDWIDFGTSDTYNVTGDFTLTAWIKPNSFGKFESCCAQNIGAILHRGSTGGFDFNINNFGGGTELKLYSYSVANGIGANGITLGEWQMVTAVHTAADAVTLYRNGVSIGSGSLDIGSDSGQSLTMSSHSGTFADFDGPIDDARIYNVALTPAQVVNLYNTRPKTFSNNASTTNMTIDSGVVIAPPALTILGNYTNNGTFQHSSGTVYFSSSSAQTLAGTMTATSTFASTTFLGAGTKTFSASASTSNNFTISAGTVVAPSTYLTIGGNYLNSGTFTHNSGTVYFSSISAQTLSGTMIGTSAFGTTTFLGSGTKTFSAVASTTRHFTIGTGATVVAPSTVLTIGGNYTNNGTFTHNSGTVYLASSTQQTLSGTMTGTSAFSNLTISNVSGLGSTTQSIIFGAGASTTGTLTMLASTSAQFLQTSSSTFQNIALNGATGQYVSLRSSSPGTKYSFYVPGTQTATYADVRDSSACPGTITVSDGADSGNNNCWTFVTSLVLSGSLYSDEGVTAITSGKTIKIAVGTSTLSLHTTTSNGSGAWTFTLTPTHTVTPSTPLVVFVDGDTTTRAALFTKASDTNSITGLDLYQNRVIVSHEGTSGTSTNIGDMSFYDSDNDGDIQYNATTSSAALIINTNQELHIKTGKTFSASGTVTVRGNASSTSLTDGTLHLPGTAIYTAVGNTNIAGSFNASSTATFSNATGTLTMNATTTGKNILVPLTTSLGTTTFNGTNGGWTFATSATTSNLTITNGTVIAPERLTVSGNYTNNGTYLGTAAWTAQTSIDQSWRSVTYGNGLFVAVSADGTNRVMTSPDGITWTPRTATSTSTWHAVIYGNGRFVAVADSADGGVMYSYDGITWATTTPSHVKSWSGVTYGNGRFVAISESSTDSTMYSFDGISWVNPAAALGTGCLDVTYGNGLFVAVSYHGSVQVVTSPDGVTWTNRDPGFNSGWTSVAYGNGRFVALTYNANPSSAMYSSNGINWSTSTATYGNDWRDVTFGNGLFVAVGATSSASTTIKTSPDGIAWTYRTVPVTNTNWWGVAYGNGRFVVVGGTPTVLSSQDSTTTFSGTSAQTIGGTLSGTSSLRAVEFRGAGTKTFTSNASTTAFDIQSDSGAVTAPSSLTIAGNYTNSGTFTAGSGTTTFSGSVPQTLAGTMTGSSAFNNVTFSNYGAKTFSANASTSNFVIGSDVGTTTAPTSLTITGNYADNSTTTTTGFFANGGTVYLAGTSQQSLSGKMIATSTFYNLTITNTSGLGSTTQSILFGAAASTTGTLTMLASTSARFLASASTTFQNIALNGTAGSYVWLRSSSPGTKYSFYVPGTQAVTYADVRDNSACPTTMLAYDGTNVDSGNNSCWSFTNPNATLSSAANQIFSYGNTATPMSTITITDATTPSITAANDIRILIATTSANMRWDTSDVTATFGGTASGKVANPVSYLGDGAMLFIPVSSDWSTLDTLTVSDLSFSQFNTLTTATTALGIRTAGSGTSTVSSDSKTVAISGALVLDNHSSGQVSDTFDSPTETDTALFAFNMAPAGESATISSLVFSLLGLDGVTGADLSNFTLRRDLNSNGTYDASDTAVGGSGAVSISEQSGTITFSTTFSATTSQDYLLVGDLANITGTKAMVVALDSANITTTGVTTALTITESGSISSIQHRKGSLGGGGSSAAIGGAPPEGDGVRGGGGAGGGGDVDSDTGDSLGNEPGFNEPSTTGAPLDQWTTGSNGYASDGSYATAASNGLRQSYGTFGFNVPSNNTITGIEVKFEGSGSTAAGTISARLSWDGGGSVTSLETTDTLTTLDAVYSLGGPSATWGRSWSATEFDNGNFTIELVGNTNSNTVKVDAIQVRVYHQATGGGGGGGGAVYNGQTQYFASVYTAIGEAWRGFWRALFP